MNLYARWCVRKIIMDIKERKVYMYIYIYNNQVPYIFMLEGENKLPLHGSQNLVRTKRQPQRLKEGRIKVDYGPENTILPHGFVPEYRIHLISQKCLRNQRHPWDPMTIWKGIWLVLLGDKRVRKVNRHFGGMGEITWHSSTCQKEEKGQETNTQQQIQKDREYWKREPRRIRQCILLELKNKSST